jgi:uncharacterized protein YkwD
LALEEEEIRPDAPLVRIAVFAFVASLVLAPTALGAERQTTLESALVRQINGVRVDRGLRPLVISKKLSAAATQHTREMGADGYFEHESFDKSPFWERIAKWYPSRGWNSWGVAENILWSSPDVTANGVVRTWFNSPQHRANMLSKNWREVGVSAIHFDAAPGEYGGGPATIVTADFGARL